MSNNNFLYGLLIGGASAAVGALLMAPKSGKELCSDISDTYNCLADKTCDLSDEIKHKSWHVLHPNDHCDTCEGSETSHFAIGATVGAVLGVATALFLAPKSGPKLRQDIEKAYHSAVEQGEDWKDNASNFIQKLQKTVGKSTKNATSSLDQVLDLASTGFQIWQNLQKRK